MLTSVPPWLQISPETFLGAAQSGAKLGMSAADALNQHNLGLAQISARAAESANQIGAERERASAALALQAAEHERAQQNTLTNLGLEAGRLDVSKGHLTVEQQRQADAEAKDKLGHDFHVGDSLLRIGPDGKVNNLFTSKANKVDPLTKMKYDTARREYLQAQAALQKGLGTLEPAELGQLSTMRDAALQKMKDLEGVMNPLSPGAMLTQPPGHVPLGPGTMRAIEDQGLNQTNAVDNDPAGLFK